jgi:hypothetical protein
MWLGVRGPADEEKDYQELEAQLPALDKRVQTYGNAQQHCAARQDYWIVSDHPYVAVTDPDGKFRIENLPAGEHTFRVWHERAGFMSPVPYQRDLKVNVEADKVLALPAFKLPGDASEK